MQDSKIKLANLESQESVNNPSKSVISNSEDDDESMMYETGNLKALKSSLGKENQLESELIARIQALQLRLKSKDQLLTELQDTLKVDDQMKFQLREKIKQLEDHLTSLKDRMGRIDDLDEDEEMKELLMKMDHKDDYDLPEGTEKNIIQQININSVGQGFLGNALMNDYQARIYFSNTKTCWGRFKIFLDKIITFFTPFKSDMNYLFARFDRNISGMFDFFRFLYIFNFFVSLSAMYLLFNHIFLVSGIISTQPSNSTNFTIHDTVANETLCQMFLPCSILYSRFTSSEKNVYSFTFLTICVVLFVIIVSQWTEYKRHYLLLKLFDEENIQFSKELFNSWDWTTRNIDSMENNKVRLKNIFTVGLKESEIISVINSRRGWDKFALYLRRTLSLFFSLIILIVDAGLVFGLYFAQAYLKFRDEDKTTNSFLDYIAMIIPSVGLLVINAIIPILLELCVIFEKWDFNSSYIVQLIWRVYISKVFTQGVSYTLLIMFLVLEKKPADVFGFSGLDFDLSLSCSSNYTLTTNPTGLTKRSYINYANCKEDQVSSIFLTNLFIDFILRKILPPVMLLFRYLICKKWKKQPNYKQSFNNINSVTNFLLFNLQIYLLIPYFPFILIISPFLVFIDFKYEVFSLKYFYDRPDKMTMRDKSGYFIMTLFTFTILGIIIVFILFFIYPLSHESYMECFTDSAGKVYQYYNPKTLCGPYEDNELMKTTIYESIVSSSM
jgi:hypothetical protein